MDSKIYKSFTELEVWQAAREYRNSVYELVNSLPSTEKYRLADQLIRASRSIGSNIAEGYGRFTYKDQLHFCIQARGSLYETHNDLITAQDCNYITTDTLNEYKEKIIKLEKLLNGYISWLKTMIQTN